MQDLSNRANMYEEVIKTQVAEEIKALKEMLKGVTSTLELYTTENTKQDIKSLDIENKYKARNKRYDFFMNDTKAVSKNITLKEELNNHLTIIKEKLDKASQ